MSAAPRISSSASSRYAKALIELAEERKILKEVEADLAAMQTMVQNSPELAHVIVSPLVNRNQQKTALFAIADKAKFQEITKNFLGVLVENRRISALLTIIEAVGKELSVRRGEMTVQVETVEALGVKQAETLQDIIAKKVGRDVVLKTKTDPSLLGGMVVTIGSQMIDGSVRRKLERLRLAMTKGDVAESLKEVG